MPAGNRQFGSATVRRVITDGFLRGLKPPERGQVEIRDLQCPGLLARLSRGGTLAWNVRGLLPDGRHGRISIGTWPAVGVAEARRRALATKAAVQGGADPVSEKRAAKAEAAARAARPTVADRLITWREARATNWSERYARETGALCARVIVPAIGGMALADTDREDWGALVTVAQRKGPAAASTLYRAISSFLGHAEAVGWIDRPLLPRKGRALLAPGVPPRQRVLDDDELLAVWHGAAALGVRARAFARLLILTAARRSEVAGLCVDELDLQLSVWRLPGPRSKNKSAHVMPLHGLAIAELRSVWPVPWREPAPPRYRLLGAGGCEPLSGFSAIKRALDGACGITAEWNIHDIRRTARTTMSRLGVAADHAEAALNHRSHRGALQKVYDVHDYQREALSALRTWQDHVAGLLHPKERGAIVRLRRRTAQ